MSGITHILVATDLSPRAELAAEQGARLARREGATLDLLHVVGRLPLEAVKRGRG
ncbi:MAG: universal stress protein [Betaproteobacteria bacterium]|nr:universal stress protein [Betaproteobacteria bacterium]